jgi:hypothetical protein
MIRGRTGENIGSIRFGCLIGAGVFNDGRRISIVVALHGDYNTLGFDTALHRSVIGQGHTGRNNSENATKNGKN